MSNEVDPKIIEQIGKLLALSQNNPEPAEAALALERAQALMKKHGVTTSDAELGPITEHPLRSWASASKTKDYELILFQGIARAFGCELMFRPGIGRMLKHFGPERYYGHYIFVGPKADVQVATYCATMLYKLLQRARNAYVDKLKERGWFDKRSLTREADGYCIGWASTVVKKVEPLVRPSVAAKVKQYVEEHTSGREAKNKSNERAASYGAMAEGMEDAKEVQVHRPMGETAGTGQLKAK